MVIGGPEGHVYHRQTLEVMPDRELVGHAHAAVKMYGLLADKFPRSDHTAMVAWVSSVECCRVLGGGAMV